ncbi:tripartite tricarboxylate transporter substrate-binding protein [Ventrimonas sp. CLA-AP-H27]|uniref:Tripartite tricarboxylate transporter substrate-binding protein n=1 Tax=Ventrimonas faecis TaxID=3133170 RepID=A0ABV1HLU4_9FIRM
MKKQKMICWMLAAALGMGLTACSGAGNTSQSGTETEKQTTVEKSEAADGKDVTIESVWPKGSTVYFDVPAKAGGGTDLYARYLTQALGEVCPDVNFVVTNYDTTEVGREHTKTAKPDGKTLLVHHGGAMIEYMTGSSEVSPKDDYKTVGVVNVGGPQAIIARPDAPYSNLQELGDYIQANPSEVVIGCTLGGASQCMLYGVVSNIGDGYGELVNWVQCGSEADKLTQTASGSIDIANCSINNALSYEADGKLKILGTMAPTSATLENMSELVGEKLPETFKTTKEQGVNYSYDSSYYVWAPAELPDDIAVVINEQIMKCVDQQGFIDSMKQMVTYIDKRDLAATQKTFDDEWNTWSEIIEQMGIKIR